MRDLLRRTINPDVIGDPACPIMHRWTLFPLGYGSASASNVKLKKAPSWMPKLLLHHFMPRADERDFHDHPRGFWTIVLKGGYDDLVPCTSCKGLGFIRTHRFYPPANPIIGRYVREGDNYVVELFCPSCRGERFKVNDVMRPGTIRYRPPEHAHRTRVHAGGAWTLVLMGPLRREWGFMTEDGWLQWRTYQKKFGYGMKCA